RLVRTVIPSVTAPATATIIFRLVEFLLLFGREHGTDLGKGVRHYLPCLFHRFATNAFNLRSGLVNDRLDLCLLIRRKIQFVGDAFERGAMPAAPAATQIVATPEGGIIRQHPAAERNQTNERKGNECEFHS